MLGGTVCSLPAPGLGVWSSKYKYMDQLSALDACRPGSAAAVPAAWSHIEIPVNMER